MVTRVEPVHGHPNRHCCTIASIHESDKELDGESNSNANNSNANNSNGNNHGSNPKSSEEDDSNDNNDTHDHTSNNITQSKRICGGRPSGTTNKSKRKYEMAEFAA